MNLAQTRPQTARLGIIELYSIMQVMRAMPGDIEKSSEAAVTAIRKHRAQFAAEAQSLRNAARSITADVHRNTRKRRALEALGREANEGEEDVRWVGFLGVVYGIVEGVEEMFAEMEQVFGSVPPGTIVMDEARAAKLHDILWLTTGTKNASQCCAIERELNIESVTRFVTALRDLDDMPHAVLALSRSIEASLAAYYEFLHRRHTVQGIKIHGDALVTDIAITLESNVDRSGEIMSGTKVDEISAFSLSRAKILAAAVRGGVIAECLKAPERFMEIVRDTLLSLYKSANGSKAAMEDAIHRVMTVVRIDRPKDVSEEAFGVALDDLGNLNPAMVEFREPTEFVSREERKARDHANETIGGIVGLLRNDASTPEEIIRYVLDRKAHKRKREVEEASFYRARVGSGNPFMGVAPGALEVYPADRPTVTMSDIVGSGYPDVAEFIDTLTLSADLDMLFASTHPTKTGEKSNGLLIGPPGCGKTEVLRAIGGRSDCTSIFVTGSDFQTCWLGEAGKNPKRLFEKAVMLSRETNRRVYITIDEVDEVLREPTDEVRGSSGVNLVNEFLQLLDGVVDYPKVSLWGATNHPERISNRMMRRFQFVRIVGELTPSDREQLLRRFLGHLPTEIDERGWQGAAESLAGAVGDVIRKVAEDIWRQKMGAFVRKDREAALKIAETFKDEDGAPIHAADMNREHRREVANRLREHFVITAADLDGAVRKALASPSIRMEIDEGVASYKRANAFLSELRRDGASVDG